MQVLHSSLLCFFLYIVTCRAAIPGITDCSTESSKGKFVDATISPCNEDPCVLVKGYNASINIQFIPTELVKAGKIVVHAIIAGIRIPLPLLDDNLCNFLKSGCDLQPNVLASMDNSLYVDETQPSTTITLRWELKEELGDDLVCIEFPIEIKSAPDSTESKDEMPSEPPVFKPDEL